MATVKKSSKRTLAPKSSSVSSRMGSYGKKMKSGGSLGMKSVKAGFDKNPGVTRADIIVAAKGQAKKGKMISKAQEGKKLPSGASSASAERDYAQSDSLRRSTKNLTGMDIFKMNKSGKRVTDIYQKADSLKREGDRKTKATGGVPKEYRFKRGGSMKKSMKTGGKMKKCAYGCK